MIHQKQKKLKEIQIIIVKYQRYSLMNLKEKIM